MVLTAKHAAFNRTILFLGAFALVRRRRDRHGIGVASGLVLIRLCQLGTRCDHRLEAIRLRVLTRQRLMKVVVSRLLKFVHAVEVVISNAHVQSIVKV